jgi:hypothetical protein
MNAMCENQGHVHPEESYGGLQRQELDFLNVTHNPVHFHCSLYENMIFTHSHSVLRPV